MRLPICSVQRCSLSMLSRLRMWYAESLTPLTHAPTLLPALRCYRTCRVLLCNVLSSAPAIGIFNVRRAVIVLGRPSQYIPSSCRAISLCTPIKLSRRVHLAAICSRVESAIVPFTVYIILPHFLKVCYPFGAPFTGGPPSGSPPIRGSSFRGISYTWDHLPVVPLSGGSLTVGFSPHPFGGAERETLLSGGHLPSVTSSFRGVPPPVLWGQLSIV